MNKKTYPKVKDDEYKPAAVKKKSLPKAKDGDHEPTISWNRYCQDSWYSDNVRLKNTPEFRIMRITHTTDYALLVGDMQVARVSSLKKGQNYFEGLLKARNKKPIEIMPKTKIRLG